jgi:hypothetical protein
MERERIDLLRRHLQIEEMSPNGLVTLLEGPDIDRARSDVVGYGQRFGILCHIGGGLNRSMQHSAQTHIH